MAKRTAEHAGREARRRLEEQREEHTKQGGALWMRYTQEVGEAGGALEAERAAHQQTCAAHAIRVVGVPPHAASRELAAAAKLQSVERQYTADKEALRVVQRLVVDALRFQHEEQRLQQLEAFQELEEKYKSARGERDALQDRFEGEWRRFGERADQHVASLRGMIQGRTTTRGRRLHASHSMATPVGRVLSAQERALASRRREISNPYMSSVCAKLGEIHLPCVQRPPASDDKARSQYDMRALLAAMDSTRKAAVLAEVNDRIVRAQQYRSVFDKITSQIRARKRHVAYFHARLHPLEYIRRFLQIHTRACL